jgi:hypothetical protein
MALALYGHGVGPAAFAVNVDGTVSSGEYSN